MTRPIVATYYFPNYHPDARNSAWHGAGWTEWELVKAARPRFPGHQQPVVPAWGHFDESDPAWAAREIDLAADHGVDVFLYDWYWHEEGPYLQDQLEQGFLKAPNRQRMRFALMWANHDWMDIHPVGWRNRPDLLARGAVTRATWERLTDHVVANYLSQPNYLLIDGCPYFTIYQVRDFIWGMGGVDGAQAAIESFRAKVRGAGFPDLHLNLMSCGLMAMPASTPNPEESRQRIVERLGCRSVGSYHWMQDFDPSIGGVFPRGSYQALAEASYGMWERLANELTVPYQPGVAMGWDSSPRTNQTDIYEYRGYPYCAVLEGNTPAAFRAALERARDFLARSGTSTPMLSLNAWNEWTEGSYLLPDTVRGTQYLEAVREVFGVAQNSQRRAAKA